MEEQLSQENFDCLKFIEKQLQEQGDVNDLIFSLKIITQETEEQIYRHSNHIAENKDQIILDTQELFKQLIDYKDYQDQYINSSPFLNQNDQLYQKLEECINYKCNIQNSLEMFEIVMQLDQIYQQYIRIIEDNDTQELFENVTKNAKIFKILLQLPKMNPRYGQIETIILLIEKHCHQDLFNSKDFALKLEILNVLDIAQRATNIYLEQRVKQMDFSVLYRNDLQVNDAQELIHQMIQMVDNELQYLRKLKQFQPFFYEYLKYLIIYFNKNLFKQFFNFSIQQNQNLDILFAYITFCKVLVSYSERGYLDNLNSLLKIAFDPYSNTIKVIIKNECQFLQNQLITKMSQTQSLNDRINNCNLNCIDLLEQSFKRTSDLSFQIAFEDWIFECVKILDNLFITLNNQLDELQLDSLGNFVKELVVNKTQTEFNKQASKFTLKANLALFEILLTKHCELNILRNQLNELDEYIKSSIENQEDELFRLISMVLREKLQQKGTTMYQDSLSIASSLRQIMQECEVKLTIQILRLLLAESLGTESDYIHNFTTNLELIESIYKTIHLTKLDYKVCLGICPKITYEELEDRGKENYFCQQTCFWAALYIIVESKVIRVAELKSVYDKFVPYDKLD